jgi:fumarate reductase flavoprotein subunit
MDRYDAVIAGAGAAGLSVATCAAAMGAHVLLIDRTDGSSSDFSKSGGGVAAAGTAFQEAAGVVDSAAIWIEDIRRKTENSFEPSITVARVGAKRGPLIWTAAPECSHV